ncbi:MAG: FAD-dependent monooxygenase [Sphingobium sp.]
MSTAANKFTEIPVLIAGGGPVGMTLALFLAHYGVASILVEQNASTTRHPKMDLTNGRSMELFRRIGLADTLRRVGVPAANPFDIAYLTSLAGHEIHHFVIPSASQTAQEIAERNDGTHAREEPLRVSQVVIEPVLKDAVDAHPLIDVRFGTCFEEITENGAEEVLATVRHRDSGMVETIRCQYLIGCDGGGSRVRRQLGIPLDGEQGVAGAYMVHFRSGDADLLQRFGVLWHTQTPLGTMIAQDDQEVFTLQRWLLPDDEPDKLNPETLLEQWAGRSFDYEILQANPWTAHFVVAQSYRKGRVILAGDAAHQYVPTGGYGMNSGIADAAALSWVLAALVQGWGGETLLTAYEEERRPTAWMHLEASQRHLGTRIDIHTRYANYDKLDDDTPEGEAQRRELGAYIENIGNAENASWGVEWGYRYDHSPIISYDGEAPEFEPVDYRPNTCPGARLPHIFLEPGVSIHDRLGSYFTAISLDGSDLGAFAQAAQAQNIPLETLILDRPDLLSVYEKPILLVRPDQHIAWRGEALPEEVAPILAKAVGR